ncbi:MAG TPA: carbamoyltransferase HypF [Nitrospirota bacterium]|nr:carbamoyltransferase HypF [Nitrospirota bacterium]
MDPMVERAQIIVRGVVQGVGFRPYVYNLAGILGLTGSITNTSEGVLIDIEGDRLTEFIQKLRTEPPPLSRITDIAIQRLPPAGYREFLITQSREAETSRPFTLVSPDVSLCQDCHWELLDPEDRRYLYPFINCTNCGPRYTITRSIPYDRPNTTMAPFPMCPDCSKEYHDPGNRRFHAQPNACRACGPNVEFKVQSSKFIVNQDDPFKAAIDLLKQGGVVAIKGLGGFHIACDATNDAAVKALRERKRKSNKPFAVMCPGIETVQRFCSLGEAEQAVLLSGIRPVVLLNKKDDQVLSEAVSPNNRYVGVMLPYTPLHTLLFRYPRERDARQSEPNFLALVMTSGNLSEEPIVRDNDEALTKLSGLVDGFLLHNRDIFMRVDDSVIRVHSSEFKVQSMKQDDPYNARLRTVNSELSFIRRSRGYAPEPIQLMEYGPEVMGCGADLKNTFTLTKGAFAIPSQHIGDMENYETLRFYEECLENLKAVYRVQPVAIAHDLHPGYLSTRWAYEQSAIRSPQSAIQLYGIQHHYAHIGSVMAENGITCPVIGVAFDGTGYGTDGKLWGGEFLIADINGFERVGQFKYIPLPGGDAAIREPWRTAVSFILDAKEERWEAVLEKIRFMKRYGRDVIPQVVHVRQSPELSPLSSGAGRLFDAVSAILGLCDKNTFEGEAAMALEFPVRSGIEDEYAVELLRENGYTVVDFAPAISVILNDLVQGVDTALIATKFHNTVSSVIRNVVGKIRSLRRIDDVALSGGTFQNRYLLERTARLLTEDGFRVMTNRFVPCNDGGISLGQAYIIRERLKNADCRMQNGK